MGQRKERVLQRGRKRPRLIPECRAKALNGDSRSHKLYSKTQRHSKSSMRSTSTYSTQGIIIRGTSHLMRHQWLNSSYITQPRIRRYPAYPQIRRYSKSQRKAAWSKSRGFRMPPLSKNRRCHLRKSISVKTNLPRRSSPNIWFQYWRSKETCGTRKMTHSCNPWEWTIPQVWLCQRWRTKLPSRPSCLWGWNLALLRLP